MSIVSKEYRTISQIAGPLVFVEKTEPVGYNELAIVTMPDGTEKRGQVLDTSDDVVVIQVFEGTAGIEQGRRRQVPRRDHEDAGVPGHAGQDPVRFRRAPRRWPGDHPGGPPGHQRRGHQPVGPGRTVGVHPDRYIDHRRDEHPGPGTEAADLLRRPVCRTTRSRCRSPGRPRCAAPTRSSPWSSPPWASPTKRRSTS